MYLSDAAAGRNSYTGLRLAAASLVLVSHAFLVTTGKPASEPLVSQTGMSLGSFSVGAFFALSGFLITQSWVRKPDLRSFMEKRARRLFPALWASLILTALMLAPLSALSLSEYLTSPGFWRYIGNGIFAPKADDLPGLFLTHPFQSTNASLWTLKFEVACYMAVAALGLVGLLRPWAMVAGLVLGMVVYELHLPKSGVLYYVDMFAYQFRFFAVGALLFFYRDRVRANWTAVAACVFFMMVASYFGIAKAVAPFFIGYATLAAGALLILPDSPGDYSYGVYVYAFPVQQLMVPASLLFAAPWLANIVLSMPLVLLLSWLSWRFIEEPALRVGVRPKKVAVAA